MMKKILLILNILIITSCKSQNNDKPINDLKMETELLSDFLKSKNYKTPNLEDFINRCSDYFNINISTLNEDYYQPIGQNSYGLSISNLFLNTFSESIFYNANTLEDSYNIEQAKLNLERESNLDSEKLIFYNKLLFNDDSSVVSYFLNNTDDLKEVVLSFDYEKNKMLYNSVFKYIETNDLDKENVSHLLFYNNPKKGYKKELIENLYIQKGIEPIKQLTDSYYNNWNSLEQKQKDECLVFLVELFINYDKTKDVTTIYEELSYSYLANFLDLDKDLENRLKSNNYYNDMKIKELISSYHLLKESDNDDYAVLAIIQDKDGYTNLRKEQNLKSEIIGKIKSGEQVNTFPSTNSDMWWVKTKNGEIGFIHKSRVKLVE